jgi:glycosyltransferase involved in cell wall biosynthesis
MAITPRLIVHNKILVLSSVFEHLRAVTLFMESVMAVLNRYNDVTWVLLDNGSCSDIRNYLATLSHPRLFVRHFSNNIGKGNACNTFIRERLSLENLPRVIFSIDSDILFSPDDFLKLARAAFFVPNVGFLSMRYRPNACNPERHPWLPARRYLGQDGLHYRIRRPLFCNVAGGIIALPGITLSTHLGLVLYPHAEGKTYYPDDAFLFDALKSKGCILGYLEGTTAHHLRSGPYEDYPENTA